MEDTYARRLATAMPASSAARMRNGMRSNPPPVILPNGLAAPVVASSTTMVASAIPAARQTFSWVATVYTAMAGASRAAPLT